MSQQPHLKSVAEPAAGYGELKYRFSNLHTLFSIRGTLAMDMMTALPPGGLPRRLGDIAAITRQIYTDMTDESLNGLLCRVEDQTALHPDNWDDWNLANLKDMRRIHTHLASVPADLYNASVQLSSEGRRWHEDAMRFPDWDDIKPKIAYTVDLYRRIGALKQKAFAANSPYEALLLSYACDLNGSDIDTLYDSLLQPLTEVRNAALQKQESGAPPLPLTGDYEQGDKLWLNRTILEMMGFDFNRGSLQITTLTPMAGGQADDARILVRCGPGTCFLDSLSDTLYQGAQGLYLQNLPCDWTTQPVGQAMGTAILNAVSLLYETIIARTPEFFEFIAVRSEGVFRQFHNKSFEPENLCRLKQLLRPSTKRNEADELTKIFHDVMRYRIERDLINGHLSVDDLPERWNEESRHYLGITPQGAAEGPIQNPDWFTGRFGFIPVNTLSYAIAAGLYENFQAENSSFTDAVRYGALKPVHEWLKTNLHEKGRSQNPLALIHAITKQPVSAAPLLSHLRRRYL